MSEDPPPGASPLALIEQLLCRAAGPDAGMRNGDRWVASNAVWLCGCVTILDESPTWLIFDTPVGELKWTRVADGIEPNHCVDANRIAGGHADPTEVLRWLQGSTPNPWSGGGAGGGDQGALAQIQAEINSI